MSRMDGRRRIDKRETPSYIQAGDDNYLKQEHGNDNKKGRDY